jgi:WD40 repeat protein
MSERWLKGRYELQSILGRGLATTTHLALDHASGERCVVKVLSLASADALKAHELLTREARVLQRLDHPRIPRLFDFFSEEDGPDTRVCLVQQHVEGKSLYELVRAGRRFGESEAIALGVKLARVLEYLHGFDAPILHRDLKPANVLVTAGERVYLVDFGAVRDHLPREMLHPSGPTIVGTRGYMPIEQFEGQAVPGSDLYALGATLVFALSGKEPAELGKQGLRLDFERHVSVLPGFARLLARLLEPDWRERPLSATEVREGLERIAELASRPRPRPRSTKSWLAALAALLAAVGLGIALWSSRGPAVARPAGGGGGGGIVEPVSQGRPWIEFLLGPTTRRDALGDPIPARALRRLGTVRLRHGGPVSALAFTPDGASVVSASGDGTTSVWNAVTGEEKHRFDLGLQAGSLAIAPDGARALVGGGTPWTVWLLDLPAGGAVARLLPAPPRPNAPAELSEVAWAREPALAATRTLEGVDLWSPRDGRHVRRLASCGAGRSLALVERGRALLVDCRDGFARVLDVASGAERRRLKLESTYLPLRVSPDERWIAVASHSRVKLVDLATGTEAGVLGGPDIAMGGVASLDFAPDGRSLAIGTQRGQVVLFDVATRAQLRVLAAQAGPVQAVALSPDGRTLAAGGAGHTVRLFDVATGAERVPASAAHAASVDALDFSRTGDTLLSAGADASVRHWDRAGRPGSVRSLERPVAAVVSLQAPRVVVVEEGRVHVYDVASGWEVTGAPLPDFSRREGVAVATTAGLLAVGGSSTLRIVDLTTGERRSFPVPRREQVLAFSPDGRVLATLRDQAEPLAGSPLVLRDTATGQELAAVPHNRGGPYPFPCRSADGSYFGFNGGLWRLASDPKSRLESHGWPGRARVCAVSPDGRFVAVRTDEPDTIEVRERKQAASNRPELQYRTTLSGHRGPVTSLVFAPDSRTLASGGADGSVLLWDVAAPGAPAEALPARAAQRGPRLQLSFDDGIEGPGVTPVRLPAESRLLLVPGRKGRALRPNAALAFPETRELLLSDGFTVSVAFQIGAEGLRHDSPNQSILSSELVTLDVREGGRALLFLHFLRQGGHTSVDLERWIGRVEAGRWYHVAVASRRADGVVRVCVDGVCGAGPTDQHLADRVGELSLARNAPWQPFAGTIDELALYDRTLSDDEMAALAGLARAVPLPSPTPAPTPTPLPRLPAEQEPLPREGRPEGKDVAGHVGVEEKSGFRVYRFGGPLARAQTLDLDLGMGAVWVGTSLGLLRHDPRTGSWRQWDQTSGLPGERLNEIAVVGGRVVADSSTPTTPGNVRGTGVLAFEAATLAWTTMKDVGGVWDFWGDGSTLWVGTGSGAQARDLETGAVRRFTRASGELVHDAVHAVRRHGETVAFAAMGDYVQETKDFSGGGVTLWDRRADRFRSYTPKDGLARGYSCDVFLDDSEVFVAHWEEELGLSRIDRRTGRVEAMRRSANGIDLGGVVLAGDRDTLWIGQQGALVKLDRASRQATALREQDGLPGYIVSGIAIGEHAVWASLYSYGQDGVRCAGLVRFPRR